MHHIYADWAATAPLHPAAIMTLRQFLDTPDPANPSAVHSYGLTATDRLDRARQELAHVLRWDGQITFTAGGTESDGLAIWSLLHMFQHTHRRRILLSPMEHPAVREALSTFAPAMGYTVEECAVTPHGTVDVSDFAARLGNDVAFAAVLAVQNETGVIQPVDTLAAMTHDCGGAFLSDCVQAVGHIPLPKEPDILTLSGHKFGAPNGTGALLAKPGTKLSPLLKGGGQEMGIRGGTENVMGICAMVSAIQAHTGEPDWMAQVRDRLETKLLGQMAEWGIPVTIAGRAAHRIATHSCIVYGCGASMIDVPDDHLPDGENIVLSCDMAGLAVSAGSACHSGERTPSATLLAMGYTEAEARRLVRMSFGWSTTAAEMEKAYEILAQTLRRQYQ